MSTEIDEPKNGQYIPTETYVDFEGGGEVTFQTKECPECFAIVNWQKLDEHVGQHESEGGAQPKKAQKSKKTKKEASSQEKKDETDED